MANVGARCGIPPFYVAFVLAPLASNASELIASYNYAKKKTQKTISVSLAALEGAACMNNTFCLAIFMGLVFFRQLAWKCAAPDAHTRRQGSGEALRCPSGHKMHRGRRLIASPRPLPGSQPRRSRSSSSSSPPL